MSCYINAWRLVLQAIGSLQKYPLPLENAREAKILQNFGDGICKLLDEKLQRYYKEHGQYLMLLLLVLFTVHSDPCP